MTAWRIKNFLVSSRKHIYYNQNLNYQLYPLSHQHLINNNLQNLYNLHLTSKLHKRISMEVDESKSYILPNVTPINPQLNLIITVLIISRIQISRIKMCITHF